MGKIEILESTSEVQLPEKNNKKNINEDKTIKTLEKYYSKKKELCNKHDPKFRYPNRDGVNLFENLIFRHNISVPDCSSNIGTMFGKILSKEEVNRSNSNNENSAVVYNIVNEMCNIKPKEENACDGLSEVKTRKKKQLYRGKAQLL